MFTKRILAIFIVLAVCLASILAKTKHFIIQSLHSLVTLGSSSRTHPIIGASSIIGLSSSSAQPFGNKSVKNDGALINGVRVNS